MEKTYLGPRGQRSWLPGCCSCYMSYVAVLVVRWRWRWRWRWRCHGVANTARLTSTAEHESHSAVDQPCGQPPGDRLRRPSIPGLALGIIAISSRCYSAQLLESPSWPALRDETAAVLRRSPSAEDITTLLSLLLLLYCYHYYYYYCYSITITTCYTAILLLDGLLCVSSRPAQLKDLPL